MSVCLGNVTYSTEHTEVWRSTQIEIRRTIIECHGDRNRASKSVIWNIDAHSYHMRLYGGEMITLRNMLAQILGDNYSLNTSER